MGDKTGHQSKKLGSNDEERKPKPRGLSSVRSRSDECGSPTWEFMLPRQSHGDWPLLDSVPCVAEPTPKHEPIDRSAKAASPKTRTSKGPASKPTPGGKEANPKKKR